MTDAGPAGAALVNFIAVMDRLRRECPWDAKQTHESLVPYLLEETYETIEAIERGDLAELRGELGDVLLQVFFHAAIAAERTDGTGFTIDDVAEGIASKLVRRHPHIFGDATVSDAAEVRRNWETIKAAERAAAGGDGPGSALDGVPMAQPALALAAQFQRRATAAGAPAGLTDLTAPGAPAPPGPTAPAEVAGPPSDPGAALGAELFALVARATAAGLDPELELRRASRRYRDRVRQWERDETQ